MLIDTESTVSHKNIGYQHQVTQLNKSFKFSDLKFGFRRIFASPYLLFR